jgi:Protein of unknown function (DUF2568)
MATANLALRFLLELAGFAGAGYAVYLVTDGLNDLLRWILAVAGGLVVIGLWGFVVAPRRQNGLSQAQKDIIGSALLLVIAGAVWVAGRPGLAMGFGVLLIVNAVLLFVFGQDARDRFESGQGGRAG